MTNNVVSQDEIIEMANQAELCQSIWIDDEGPEIASLVAFAKLVAAKEREACAKVCEWYSVEKRANINYSEECAQGIRARGETTLRGEA